jgi:hypothetical protein
MVVKIRCTACGKTVAAARTAGARQKVCGKQCRSKRKRKLARKRRQARVVEYRQDEARRKREQRARQKAAGRPLTAGPERASRQGSEPCHAPASAANMPDLGDKVDHVLDAFWQVSRARLREDIERMILPTAGKRPMPPARAGP